MQPGPPRDGVFSRLPPGAFARPVVGSRVQRTWAITILSGLIGCRGECGLDFYGGGSFDLAMVGDPGRASWGLTGAPKSEIDQAWADVLAGGDPVAEGGWLVFDHRSPRAGRPRQILVTIDRSILAGNVCDQDHRLHFEALLTDDGDGIVLTDVGFAVSAADGTLLVEATAPLDPGTAMVSAAPYLEGSVDVPRSSYRVDPSCSGPPTDGSVAVSWSLEKVVRAGGPRTCNEVDRPVESLPRLLAPP